MSAQQTNTGFSLKCKLSKLIFKTWQEKYVLIMIAALLIDMHILLFYIITELAKIVM